ncbi:hypothetical protein MATL_G00137850 [Megalops atlanticus]|uniref:Inner centromere protein n=1 Tax=Megalops atlanticus TaxID=7932 RepID=A0A9D3PXJ0_MEGAT|nr:hypothetical protein MATL_G00137850 [Megalops atlanticus]
MNDNFETRDIRWWSSSYITSETDIERGMNSLLSSTRSLMEMFDGKLQEFANNVESVHMVWLEEIQQEANRMFSSDFSAEPELMPKTPSQKKSSRRKHVSMGRDEAHGKRRFSKGKRTNLRRSSVQTLQLIAEDQDAAGADASPQETQPKRNARRNNKQKQEEGPAETESPDNEPVQSSCQEQEEGLAKPKKNSLIQAEPCSQTQNEDGTKQQQQPEVVAVVGGEPASSVPPAPSTSHTTPEKLMEAVVEISAAERTSADLLQKAASPCCRTATKLAIARPPESHAAAPSSRRSSGQHSLVLRRSLAGLRHSMTRESVRRASRRSFLKMKARMNSSTCSSNASGGVCVEMEEEEEALEGVLPEHPTETEPDPPQPKEDAEEKKAEAPTTEGVRRFTRSMAQNSTPTNAGPARLLRAERDGASDSSSDGSGKKKPPAMSSGPRSSSTKRRAPEAAEALTTPKKKSSLPKSQTVVKPNMKAFLQTVQKNQLLMMTPGSVGRSAIVKSFIKHTTPLRTDLKERERLRLEALKKKQEQENERKKKLEEEKKRKQEEMKRKRDERLRKVVEARVKEEQKEEEKKKKIEQKMAQMEEKNDKLRVERLAEEKAKKKVATKRQEELEQRRKQEEEARRKRIQQAEEEEKRQQELLAKRQAEEEQERARKLAEARRALELKKEQERERELERERERERERLRQEAAERERMEKKKALALQRELEKAAREKELREAEERKKKEEQQRQAEQEKAAAAAAAAAAKIVTVEIQKSPMKSPVGKGPGLNVTVDVENSVLKTPAGKGPGLNVTVDVEKSPQSYELTPKGGNKPVAVNPNPDDYGMDQNSDDSTDDESAPRKPIPSWAQGRQLQQSLLNQYFNPVDVDSYFGEIVEPKLEEIFNKSKPRYFKRTSSAVWDLPPQVGTY